MKRILFWVTCINETYTFSKQRFPDLLTGHLKLRVTKMKKEQEVHNGERD